jgi:hypothetical protein
MKYRITVTTSQKFIVEGDEDFEFAEARIRMLSSGYIDQHDGETVRAVHCSPMAVLEVLIDPEINLWVEALDSNDLED